MSDEQGKPVYVGFWKRVAASLIDNLAVFAVILPVLVAVHGTSYFSKAKGGLAGPVDFLLQVVFPAVAVILFWKFRGATPGKMLVSARVVDAKTLGPLSSGQAIGRYFAYFVSILPLMLGFLWVAFDKRKQGFHDKLAGTVVIEVEDDE
ncbi:MAG: RDD family protein [Betaproteobacteria bacterium]|nr:RDD family protein [Betaproteobacteria bacterium]